MSVCQVGRILTPDEITLYTQRLADLEAAKYKILVGQVARIRHNEKWIEYHKADIGALDAEIRDIRGLLGQGGARPRSVRLGF